MVASELRDIDFDKIRHLVYEKCGINLHEGKKELVNARLAKRLRERDFRSFSQYYRYVITEEGTEELVQMIDSISTNLTYFFREESHFIRLRNILPVMMDNAKERGAAKFLLWSAGCSTGEEPYSLAMTIRESIQSLSVIVKILATDISTRVLKTAEEGVYPQEKIKGITADMTRKYFQQGADRQKGFYRIKKDIRDMVHFKRFNLMAAPPAGILFDIIFCRNVMIYFDKVTQEGLINRFYGSLVSGGYLFIGHSESLTGLKHDFKYIEPSVYRK